MIQGTTATIKVLHKQSSPTYFREGARTTQKNERAVANTKGLDLIKAASSSLVWNPAAATTVLALGILGSTLALRR